MRFAGILALLGVLFALCTTDAHTADDPKKQAALTPETADADFPIQGEYLGEIDGEDGKLKYGVQIIALGDGKFRAVGHLGGLPGAGWIGEGKMETEGERIDGQATFKRENHQAVVTDDGLEIQDLSGLKLATFEKVVRKSKTLGKKPPAGAVVLFDGKSAGNFKGGRLSEDGLLMQGVTSKQTFGDCTIHLEFMLSYMPHARGQGRSNSGCYLQGRHEVQILDSFGLSGENNECGGIYTVRKPSVNMCLPPLSWQTYDIDFIAAKFDKNGEKTSNAKLTVRHNDVLIHKDVEVPYATRAAPLKEGPEPGPIFLQDHSNPLRFRNIWVVPKTN